MEEIHCCTGETTSDNRGCGQVSPEIGITATPVIDRTRGPNGAIYVVAMSKDASGNYFQRLHALDLATGAELFGGPTTVQATYPGTGDNSTGGNVVFDAKQYKERPGLLEIGTTIYTTWSSHCDDRPYTSWVMSYDANALTQTSVLNLVPNGSEGGIWMAGTAPAADASGNIYFMVGNGDFDTTLNASGFPSNGDCGQCYVKLSSSAPMKLLDYFTPSNTVSESNADTDFGSGGPLLLPDLVDANGNTRHLAVGSGKDAIIYVVDRDNMGKFNSSYGQYLSADQRSDRRRLVQAQLFQQYGLLRRGRRPSEGLPDHQRETFDNARDAKFRQLRLSGDDAEYFGERHFERDCVGRGKWFDGRAARLQRNELDDANFTTRIRPPTIAISSATTSTSRRWWPTAKSTSARRTASWSSVYCPNFCCASEVTRAARVARHERTGMKRCLSHRRFS